MSHADPGSRHLHDFVAGFHLLIGLKPGHPPHNLTFADSSGREFVMEHREYFSSRQILPSRYESGKESALFFGYVLSVNF
jgi:hypothetical protein